MYGPWTFPFPDDAARLTSGATRDAGWFRAQVRSGRATCGARVRISVAHGVAVLRGSAPSREVQRELGALALQLDGVRDVCNQVGYPRD